MRGTIVDVMTLFPNATITETLTSEINKETYPSEVRRVIVEALESISRTGFPDSDINKTIKSSLILLLNDQLHGQSKEEEKRVKLIAARTLMRLGDQRGVDELILLARDSKFQTSDRQSRIGQEVFEALAGHRDGRAVAFFLEQKVDDEKKTPRMQRLIIEALAQIGDSDVVKKLSPLIGDNSVQIRRNAVQALGRTGTPIAAPLLLKRLHNETANSNKRKKTNSRYG